MSTPSTVPSPICIRIAGTSTASSLPTQRLYRRKRLDARLFKRRRSVLSTLSRRLGPRRRRPLFEDASIALSFIGSAPLLFGSCAFSIQKKQRVDSSPETIWRAFSWSSAFAAPPPSAVHLFHRRPSSRRQVVRRRRRSFRSALSLRTSSFG